MWLCMYAERNFVKLLYKQITVTVLQSMVFMASMEAVTVAV